MTFIIRCLMLGGSNKPNYFLLPMTFPVLLSQTFPGKILFIVINARLFCAGFIAKTN